MQKTGNGLPPVSGRTEVLGAHDLRKAYGNHAALQGLTFSLSAGRVLGFLGPNGAGKTTSIRILTTILRPDSGGFHVNGIQHVFPNKIRQSIGVLPESLGFPKNMTGIEFLTYFGQLYGRAAVDAQRNAAALLEEVGLQPRASSSIRTYSRGMRQRLGIARALVNDPVVVFLDEPTLGLDPRGQQELLALVRRIAQDRGVGIVLCSHQLAEIEVVCDDVVILNRGRVVVHGTVSDVVALVGQMARASGVLRLRVPVELADEALEALKGSPLVRAASRTSADTGWLRVALESGDEPALNDEFPENNRILEVLIQARIPILHFETEGGRLQDVFFQLTEEAPDA